MLNFDCIGVDVAKDKLDAVIKIKDSYKHRVFSNNIPGYQKFLAWVNEYTTQAWVCMEATGHYSELFAEYLAKQAVRVSVVNPLQIKNFAKACLIRNKNDIIDAKVIREFCSRMQPRLYQALPPEQKEVKELVKLLDLLKGQLTQLTNQLHSTQSELAKQSLAELISKLKSDIASIEAKIAQQVASNTKFAEKVALLTTIKGIGKLTAYHLLALIPDVSVFKKAKQLAAFIGITPKQNQSGNAIGKTTISKVGNAQLRKSLYMAALVAKKHNKALSGFVIRLQQKGKSPKIVICAVMRKLVHYIFGVLKNNLPFDENFSCI